MFEKTKLNLIKKGKLSLKNAGKLLSDNEEAVLSAVEAMGAEEFQYASKRLRSDAVFILELSKKNPAILQYMEEVLYDRTVTDHKNEQGETQYPEVWPVWLAILCDDEAIKYLPTQYVKDYYDFLKQDGGWAFSLGGTSYKFFPGTWQNREKLIKEIEDTRSDIFEIEDGLGM